MYDTLQSNHLVKTNAKLTMNNFFHTEKWKTGVVQLHLDPPPTPLIKMKHNDKADKDFVKIKFRRYLMSEKSDPYELKMAFFDNGNPEEFFCS